MLRDQWAPGKKPLYIKGMYIKSGQLKTIRGNDVEVPDQQYLIHLQFRRFAGCPICNLHLQSFKKRSREIRDHHIREVIFFHSDRQELLKYTADFPFDIVADPRKLWYREYGVVASVRSLLNMKAIQSVGKAVLNSFREFIREKKPFPPIRPQGGSFGLPADFLIATDGCILDCHYGRHADDQWSVDELLGKVRLLQTNNINTFQS